MKYLCLIYGEERVFDALSKREFDALVDEHLDYDGDLRRSGQLIVAEALESVTTATSVRVRHGKISVTDGPFAETKEQLTGFYLITARDLNEAVQLAAKIPAACMGTVEVRPIRELYGDGTRT